MEIKKFLLWQNLIRPKSQPSDTIFYYPMKWDIKDYSWNGYDLTVRQWSINYNDNTYITVPGSTELVNSSAGIAVDMNNYSYTFACTLRNFPTNAYDWWYQESAWVCAQYFTGVPQWVNWILEVNNWWSWWWDSWTSAQLAWSISPFFWSCNAWNNDRTWIYITWSEWKKIICTYDKTTWVRNMYLWTSLTYSKSSWSKNSWTWVVLFHQPYWSYWPSYRFYKWDAKNFILTKWVWGSGEIQRYNQLP